MATSGSESDSRPARSSNPFHLAAAGALSLLFFGLTGWFLRGSSNASAPSRQTRE